MRQAIRRRHSPEVTAAVAGRYGLDPAHLVELDGFENVVFDAGDLVLRVTHSMRRTTEQVAAEVAWVNHLVGSGCPVAPPVPAADGSPVVTVADPAGGHFVAAAFAKAAGVVLDDDPAAKERHWNADLFARWGAGVARLHANGSLPTDRPHWHEIDEIAHLEAHLGTAPPAARAAARAHVAELRAAPLDGYGLVHGDPSQWNFVVDDTGHPTFFDFDSSMRCWFVMDVAVAAYYARVSVPDEDEAEFTAEFLDHFVRGYRAVRPLSAADLARLPVLLRLQTVILYSLAHRDLGESGAETTDFRARAERRLLGEQPDLDLSAVALLR